MPAPFASPPWQVQVAAFGLLVSVVAIPFAMRDDWIRPIALIIMYTGMFPMWALMIRAMVVNTLEWWRGGSDSD